MAIDDAARRQANKVLSKISSHNKDTYYSAIPLDRIYDAVENVGYHIPDDERSCILCGHDGKATWPLFYLGRPVNRGLSLTWHRMDSGRFEIIAYVT